MWYILLYIKYLSEKICYDIKLLVSRREATTYGYAAMTPRTAKNNKTKSCMDELKYLTVFNLILLALIIYCGLIKKISLTVQLSLFIVYNLIFYVAFFFNGSGGQGFAWVFLNSIFSIAHFILLIAFLIAGIFKKRKKI